MNQGRTFHENTQVKEIHYFVICLKSQKKKEKKIVDKEREFLCRRVSLTFERATILRLSFAMKKRIFAKAKIK